MREILFRGKPLAEDYFDKWVFGDLRHGGYYIGDAEVYIANGSKGYLINQPVDPETVGQFTGLTDKNGKKVFEGDIVRVCLDPEICIGDVIWDSEIASYNIPFSNGKCVLPLDIFIAKNKVGDKVWIEAIGNIHDNPELVEVDYA